MFWFLQKKEIFPEGKSENLVACQGLLKVAVIKVLAEMADGFDHQYF